jgi:GNAT superfamily N-acetyltransferase
LRKLDGKTRKLLTIHGQHHPKADVDHLYVSRKYRGRGLMQLEEAYLIEITKLMEYVDSTEDPLIQIARTHQNNTKPAMVQMARSLRTELQKGTRQIEDSIAEKTKEKWQGIRMQS